MDLAFKAIQPATHNKAVVRMTTKGGKSGHRARISNSALHNTSATSNSELVIRMLPDVVAPYAQGA
jgi:hypothetical protein